MKNTLLFPIKLRLTKTSQPTQERKMNKKSCSPKHQTKTTPPSASPEPPSQSPPKNNQPKTKHQTKQTQILVSELEFVLLRWSEGYHTAFRGLQDFCPIMSWVLVVSGPVPVYRLKLCLNLSYVGVRSLSGVLVFWWRTCAISLCPLKWMQQQQCTLGELYYSIRHLSTAKSWRWLQECFSSWMTRWMHSKCCSLHTKFHS